MQFELHCHTHYSKGTKIPKEVFLSPTEVIRLAKKRGFDTIAVTDHKVTTAWAEAKKEAKKQKINFIPGQEIESKDGHVLGLRLNRAVKNNMSAEETLEAIKEQGGFSVAPHPFDIKNDGIKEECFSADAVEVFNSFSIDRLSNWYTQRRVKKEGKPMVAGSDVHVPEMMGLCTNTVHATTVDEMFKEILKKRVGFQTSYVSVGSVVNWARDRMYYSYDDVIKYINRNYWEPKATISKGLMGFFIAHKTRLWNVFGGFAIGLSVLYSGAKLLTY